MKALKINILFFLIPIHMLLAHRDGFKTTASELDANTFGFRGIPSGLDKDTVEVTYSTFINGDLSVSGTIRPTPGVGNAKERSYVFPSTVIVNRLSATPDTKFNDTYGANNRPIPTWAMVPSSSTQRFLSVLFQIPDSLDTSINPTVDLYIAVSIQGQPAGRTAKFNISADYEPSGNIIGISSPATGLSETVLSADLSITEPTGTSNLKIYKVSVTLTGSLVTPGGLCGLYFHRVAPSGGTEYNLNVYLVAAAFNFTTT